MRIYVAGPMRGFNNFNWNVFEAVAKQLRAKGHDVVSPTEIDEGLGVVRVVRNEDGTAESVELTSAYNFETVIKRDLEVIVDCDAIFLLPGWSRSEGAKMEFDVAERAGLKIFSGLSEVPDVTPEAPHPWAIVDPPEDEYEVVLDFQTGKTYDSRTDGPKPFDYPILDAADELRHQQRWGIDETRVVSETGGMKNKKPCQFSTAPPLGMEELGKVCGWPSDTGKYPRNNYRKGYAWSLSLDAAYRHILRFQDGEDLDPETGLHHLAHAAWHCLALIQFGKDYPEGDDRWAS